MLLQRSVCAGIFLPSKSIGAPSQLRRPLALLLKEIIDRQSV